MPENATQRLARLRSDLLEAIDVYSVARAAKWGGVLLGPGVPESRARMLEALDCYVAGEIGRVLDFAVCSNECQPSS